MIGIAIDALVLMALLKMVSDDDFGFWLLCGIGLIISLATSLLAFGLYSLLGYAGIFVAGVVAAMILGILVKVLFQVEWKQGLLVGGVFMVVHIAKAVLFGRLSG